MRTRPRRLLPAVPRDPPAAAVAGVDLRDSFKNRLLATPSVEGMTDLARLDGTVFAPGRTMGRFVKGLPAKREGSGGPLSTLDTVETSTPGAASRETVKAIREWAARLDYRPNPHAKSLRTARSNLIGVLVPRLSDVVLATIYEGIEDAAARHGLATFVMNSHDRPEKQRARTDLALSRRVDGLVLGDAHSDAQLVDEIAARNVPFVLVSRHAGDHPSVTCDDYLGGKLVAEHFLELGHEQVGVI